MDILFPTEWAIFTAIAAFIGIFVRLVGFLLFTPLWSDGITPTRVRTALAIHITLIFMLGLRLPQIAMPESFLDWFLLIAPEFCLGAAMGLIVRVVLAAAEGMGEMSAYTMGLGFATFVDPSTGGSISVISRMLRYALILLFFIIDAHLHLLRALMDSFMILGVGEITRDFLTGTMSIALLGTKFFELSLRLASPVLAMGLMLYAILAVVSRVVPQMNLFAFGFAITIPAGFIVIFAETPVFVAFFYDQLNRLPEVLRVFVATGNTL